MSQGNLGGLQINVTANTSAIDTAMRQLDARMNSRNNNLVINTTGATASIGAISSAMNMLGSQFSSMGPMGQQIGNTFNIMGQAAQRSHGSIMQLVNTMGTLRIAQQILPRQSPLMAGMQSVLANERAEIIRETDRLNEARAIIQLRNDNILNRRSFTQPTAGLTSANIEQELMRLKIALNRVDKGPLTSFGRISKDLKTEAEKRTDVVNALKKVNQDIVKAERILETNRLRRDIAAMFPQTPTQAIRRITRVADSGAALNALNQERLALSFDLGNINDQVSSLRRNMITTAREEIFTGIKSAAIGLVKTLPAVLSSLIAIGGALELIKQVVIVDIFKKVMEEGIQFNRQIEQVRASFKVLMGETQTPSKINFDSFGQVTSSGKLVKQMQELAAVTPLVTTDIADAGNVLMGYGVTSKNMLPTIAALGDVSMGNSDKFRRMSLAFGQVWALGRLQGQDLLQFINAGFNPLIEIATAKLEKMYDKLNSGPVDKKKKEQYIEDNITETMSGLKEDMQNGKIGIDQVADAFNRAVAPGGRFNKMMFEMSQTFDGLFSTVKDKFAILAGALSKPIFDGLKGGLKVVIDLFNKFSEPLKEGGKWTMLDEIAFSIDKYVVPALEEMGKTILYILGIKDGLDISDVIGKSIKEIGSLVEKATTLVKVLNLVYLTADTLWNTFFIGVESATWAVTMIAGYFVGLKASTIATAATLALKLIEVFTNASNIIRTTLENAGLLAAAAIDAVVNRKPIVIPKLKVAEKLDLSDVIKDVDKISKENAWGKGNKLFEEADRQGKDILDRSKKISENMEAIWDGVDTSKVDKYLKDIASKKPKPIDYGNITAPKAGTSTEDAKALASAWDQVAKSIESAMNKLVNLSNVFSKLSYEHFTVGKLEARLKRFTNEFVKWQAYLVQLSSTPGITPGMIAELQGMGIQGMGITSALAKAPVSKASSLASGYLGLQQKAVGTAVSTVMYEHSGTIRLVGVNSKQELVGIVDVLASEIVREKKSNSMSPALANLYK